MSLAGKKICLGVRVRGWMSNGSTESSESRERVDIKWEHITNLSILSKALKVGGNIWKQIKNH